MIQRLFLLAILMSIGVSAISQSRRNVLFIAVDGLRPSSLGCYGNTFSKTPNFDRLAKRSLVFKNAFTQQANCAPSRASLMTGMRPDTLKITTGNVHFRSVLPDLITLPQLFKQNGYHTQAIGLVSHAHPAQPDDISWTKPETLLDIPKRDEYLLPSNRTRGFIDRMTKGTATEYVDAPDNAYQDGQVTQLAIETLDSIRDKPFFLAVGFKRPHLPYTCPKKYWDLYDRASIPLPADRNYPDCTPQQAALRYSWSDTQGEMRAYTDMPKKGPLSDDKIREVLHGYYASVSYVDQQVGRLLHTLDSLKLLDNTIIVVWADHGIHLGERGLWGKNDLTDDATRIPFMISVPGMQTAGLSTEALVETVDVYPTLAGICSLPIPYDLQGTSMAPLLKAPAEKWKEAVFSRYPRARDKVMSYSVRTATHRYNEYVELATGKLLDAELYDVITDPLGYKNLVNHPASRTILARHRDLLKTDWRNITVQQN
jgi:iduronate 2-sulfatase